MLSSVTFACLSVPYLRGGRSRGCVILWRIFPRAQCVVLHYKLEVVVTVVGRIIHFSLIYAIGINTEMADESTSSINVLFALLTKSYFDHMTSCCTLHVILYTVPALVAGIWAVGAGGARGAISAFWVSLPRQRVVIYFNVYRSGFGRVTAVALTLLHIWFGHMTAVALNLLHIWFGRVTAVALNLLHNWFGHVTAVALTLLHIWFGHVTAIALNLLHIGFGYVTSVKFRCIAVN